MRKIYNVIATALFALLAGSCMNDTMPADSTKGKGQFVLSILTERVETEDMTRNAGSQIAVDVNTFKVTLKDKSGAAFFSGKQYKDLTEHDRSLPVDTDYQILVESCSDEESVSSNNGWGQPHFFASENFNIVSGETTPLALECSMNNAGLMMIFSESFITKFPAYAATTQDARALVFNNRNASKVAYYTFDGDTDALSLRLTGSAGGWNDRIDIIRDITLTKGKITRVTVSFSNSSTDMDIDFDTDTDMTESNDDAIIM